MDKLKAPWKWDTNSQEQHDGNLFFPNLKDNRGSVVLSVEGQVNKENAAIIEAAPLLLKGCSRAYKNLISNLERIEKTGPFILDVEMKAYLGILESGLKQAGVNLKMLIEDGK